jgi:HEAT repeat protein
MALATCGRVCAQDEPYRQLRAYDFQERASLAAIQKQIVEARGAPARLAPIEAKLIAVLKDPGAKFGGKQEACKFLGSMGTAQSVPALLAMLKADIRQADAARYALERIAAPEAAAALRGALASATGPIRIGIVNSLGARRDGASVPALRKLALSQERATRLAAVEALGMVGSEDALAALQAGGRRDVAVQKALLRCAEGLVRSGKPAAAQGAYVALAQPGMQGVVRVSAMRALAAMRSARTGGIALPCLKDADVYVRRGAAHVVGRLADRAATAQAIKALPKLPAEVQVVLLTAWSDRGEAQAADAALALASSNAHDDVRRAAMMAAVTTGGARLVPAIAEMAAAGVGVASEALTIVRGKPSGDAIVRLAREGKPEVRSALMAVLAERPGPASTAALLAGMREADQGVAVAALRGLAVAGGAAEVAPLTATLVGAERDDIREAAGRGVVAAVQRLGQRDTAVGPVVAALGGASVAARVALLGVLADIGGARALEALTASAASEDADVKRAAVKGLAETWTDSAPIATLLQIARSDGSASIRVLALRGYIRLVGQDGGMQAGAKVTALDQALQAAQRPDERRQAFGALRDCRVEAAATLLAGFLKDPEVAQDAAEAILDLAVQQRRNDRDLPAVRGASMTAALDGVAGAGVEESVKARARSLK